MKKKNNKKLFIILAIVLLIVTLTVVFVVRSNTNKRELTLSERRWIEDNKKSMIDIYVMNNLPVFSTEENDIFLSFLTYFEAETGLSLNKVSYSLSSALPSNEYIFRMK